MLLSYLTHRNSATDIPTLAVAVSRLQDKWNIVIGARPQKAMTVDAAKLLSDIPTQKEVDEVVEYVMQNVKYVVLLLSFFIITLTKISLS